MVPRCALSALSVIQFSLFSILTLRNTQLIVTILGIVRQSMDYAAKYASIRGHINFLRIHTTNLCRRDYAGIVAATANMGRSRLVIGIAL